MTLTQDTLGQNTLLKQALLVLAGSAIIAIAAKVSVPLGATSMTPVSYTHLTLPTILLV